MRKFYILLWSLFSFPTFSQTLENLILDRNLRLEVRQFVGQDKKTFAPPYGLPLLSFELNKKETSTLSEVWSNSLEINILSEESTTDGLKMTVVFRNISKDTINLRNVVPFGHSDKHVYITGLGEHGLSRAYLFVPGRTPVNVIVPDNAWELGYSGVELGNGLNVWGFTRRKSWEKATRRRFESIVSPGGTVTYEFRANFYVGNWQEGIRAVFQKKFLFDVNKFDDSLYQRKDLAWIRDAYVMHLVMAWDNWFYDKGKYQLSDFLKQGQTLYGGNDAIGIWPTWPTLGLDQRNQWDLFRDLPGGLPRLKELAKESRQLGTAFFICYNPWDESTRKEGHLNGLAELIKTTDADGVVLDTRGASSRELQATADGVKPGVVMYSEGMAVPKDMPGIVSGRVHNALYYPPMLNLNKFIKPDFSIFRVAELYLEPIRREFATAFFNGYGTELNVFRNGKPVEWMDEQYRFWGQTARILRENSPNFHDQNYTPLIPTTADKIYVNRWPTNEKTIYTIFSLIPEGYKGLLFEADSTPVFHYVDLWHHRELRPIKKDGKYYVEAETDAFHQKWLGTNNEGALDCIARLPVALKASPDIQEDKLYIEANAGTEIRVWAGSPTYEKKPVILPKGKHNVLITSFLGRYEGKIVVQLFDGKYLLDERIVEIKPGTPKTVYSLQDNEKKKAIPRETGRDLGVLIPAGTFKFVTSHGDDWVFYPEADNEKIMEMLSFKMDKNLVTNVDFQAFMKATRYRSADTTNFLKHWQKGKIPRGMENYPVVYVSYEDAQAYCRWVGKRLPTEREWQYAAQNTDGRLWPWGNAYDSTRCNPGNGKIDSIGKYQNGANPLGINDLVGNVWQLTNDVYQNGSYRYVMLKGGSFFKPIASWWYVQGGPQPLTYRQQLLRVSEGFERNGTIGFRCVSD